MSVTNITRRAALQDTAAIGALALPAGAGVAAALPGDLRTMTGVA
jgi:hypothetical protein